MGAFVLGFAVAVFSVFGLLIYLSFDKKEVEKKLEEIKNGNSEVQKTRELHAKVKPKIDRITEITNEQLQLKSNSEQPSKNAVHSRYKNNLIGQFKALDDEKTQLLREVVEEGYDPLITIEDEFGETKSITLSEHLYTLGVYVGKYAKPEEPKVREKTKFFIVKNDDGEPN